MKTKLEKLLKERKLFFDGATGTMLQKNENLKSQMPEEFNISEKEFMTDVHTQYINAGANFITTNTFGAFNFKFNNLEEIISTSIENVRNAISKCNKDDVFIALDLGPTGKLLEPIGDLTFDECYNIYKESAKLGEKHGADVALIETMSDTYEAKASILAVKENTDLPVFCTMTLDEKGNLLTGGDIYTMVALLEGLNVDALGLNCGFGTDHLLEIIDTLMEITSIPVIIQPNAGIPVLENGKTVFKESPEEFAKKMLIFAQKGVSILGGCCGTTPEHIKAMVELCKNEKASEITDKNITFVSSYNNTVILGNTPVIIGERINPTGKKLFKQALINNDINYILNEAVSQRNKGAHILDVNVGLPDINEKETMCVAVKALQKSVNLPLQIDSSSPDVIESALRIYNGKALINSVNGKKSSMEKIFPLAKKYGGVVVGLTLDETGIPPTAEERFNVAKNIVETAESYGIHRKNIIIDCLTLTISAQQSESTETLKALNLVKERLGVKTILGVSNISFGLPSRDIINSTFFANALQSGLDCCIINPLSDSMMEVFHAHNALCGNDKNCFEFINLYGNAKANTETNKEKTITKSLIDIIIEGNHSDSYEETINLLKSIPPVEVVSNHIMVALDKIGKDFESNKIFLPQLVLSSDSAKISFEAIKEYLENNNIEQEKKGTLALATVEGDIHDIGKNIIKALLSNYGYEVIDLGKNVSHNTILDCIKENNLKLVGLSALMTTTVSSMENTIKKINESYPDCKVMVGGAVLNQEYADKIKADFYGKDALSAIAIANKVFES